VWSLHRSSNVRALLCAPGNGGISKHARCVAVQPNNSAGILALARSEKIDLVVVGPEAPLADGLADTLLTEGVAVLGPSAAAARLESSKVFSKEFMARHGIPTAQFRVMEDDAAAFAVLDSAETRYPLVVKADGLAAGKGVVVARNREEARDAVRRIMVDREFGPSGSRIVLEEFLEGLEASYIVFTDGETILPAVASRDHKAAYDNDRGPNTGGMGAFSTDEILGAGVESLVLGSIVRPVVHGMKAEGTPFRGILYCGLMLTSTGQKVLEFNVRMGDPEGQVILPRLESDFAKLCEALCSGRLEHYRASWTKDPAVCVVLASGGYPGSYAKGKTISGMEMAEEDGRIMVFHAGTKREGNSLLTDGGRVLGVTAVDRDLPGAIMAAYDAVNKINFEGMQYRRDIGASGVRPSSPD
jgi:phosphoribosylamine--glycine ligase